MARRSVGVRPDRVMQTPLGDINVVSQEALVKALVDAAVVLDMSGGVLMVQLGRVPTGIENEMVTSGALVTWMDRGDARAQPEATVDIFPALDAADEEEDVDGSEPQAAEPDEFLPVVDENGVVHHAEDADVELAAQGA